MSFFYLVFTKISCFYLYNTIVSISARHDGLFRAIGGRDVASGEFPYVVRVEILIATNAADGATKSSHNHHICTASVLSATVTLTAGHCCDSFKAFKGVIRYGSAPGRPTEVDRFSEVLSCIKLPSARGVYNPMMDGDLALLTTQPIPLGEYARLSALDHHTLNGQRITILGYGLTNHSGSLNDTLNLQLPLQVLDAMWSRCELNLYPNACAVKACGQHVAVCPGDSGGPVVHTSGIVGITSMSPANSCQLKDSNLPQQFGYIVPISSSINWISDQMAEVQNKQYYH